MAHGDLDDGAVREAWEVARGGTSTGTRGGDAVGRLVAAVSPVVRRRAGRRLRGTSPHDADDLAQETLLVLLTGLGRLREPSISGLWAYVAGIERNLVDRVRVRWWRERRLDVAGTEAPSEPRDPARLAEDREVVAALRATVPDGMLALLEGTRTTANTARRERVSPEAIRMRMHRLRKELRARWNA